jgi:hypothetical protein
LLDHDSIRENRKMGRTPDAGIRASTDHNVYRRMEMPRYMIERTFPDGLHIPINEEGAKAAANVVSVNAEDHVTWVHSYVSDDKKKSFCVYDGPNPEAIRRVATRNGLPLDRITQVSVLDPYFYR